MSEFKKGIIETLKSEGTTLRDLLSEDLKIGINVSDNLEFESLISVVEKFNVHGFNIVEQIKDGFGNSLGFLEELVEHDKKEVKLRSYDNIIRDQTAEELKKIHSDHYKKIENIDKKKEDNKKEKKEKLKDLAGTEEISVARESITGNALTKAIKLKMFDINKGFSESLKGIPLAGKSLSKFFSPESKNQQNIDELKDVEKQLEAKRKALTASKDSDKKTFLGIETSKEKESLEKQIQELEDQKKGLTSKIGSETEGLVKTENESSNLEFQKLSQESILQTELLKKIDATLNRTDISNELRLDLEELRINQNDKLIEAQEGMKKIFKEGQQTEQQERQSEKQEEEIAKKEERTWMEKLFSSLSGGESEVKPQNDGGGFFGFLALTGLAIGALVATALAPFVVWLKSRLDIIKSLMPDEMLNKIDDLFTSVKTKFIEIKASVIQKIDDIKQWFSKLKDDILKKFEPVIQKFDELKGKLLKKFEPVTRFFESLGGLFGKADEASPSLFKKLTSFLGFFDGIFGLFRGFLKGFTVVFGFLSRVLGRIPFIGQIIDFAVGIFKGFQEGLNGMDLLFSGITGIFAGGIGGTVDLLVDGLNWILGLFGFDLKKSLGLGEDFSFEKLIRDGLFMLKDFLMEDLFSDDTWRFVGEIFDGILLDMEYAWSDLKQIVLDFWDGLMLDVEYIWMSITTSLSGIFTSLETKWEEIKKEYGLDTIFNSVSEMFNNFLNLFSGENINKNIEEFKKKFTLDNIFNSITGIFEYLGSLFDPSAFKKTLKSMALTVLPEFAVNKIFGKDDSKTPKPEKSPEGTPNMELDPKKSKELVSKAKDSGLFIDGWFSDSVDASKLKDASTETLQALLQTDLDSENTKLVKSELENRRKNLENQESIRGSVIQSPTNPISGALDNAQSQQNRLNSERLTPVKTTDQSMVNSGNVVSNTTNITAGLPVQESPSF